MGFRVEGFGFRVSGLGFRVNTRPQREVCAGSGHRSVPLFRLDMITVGLGFRVKGLGFSLQDLIRV